MLKLGLEAEKKAADYLMKQGLKPVTRNFRCPMGELDLIMQDDDSLVFVEVRLRRSCQFASALESVDFFKQKKLRKTAQYYLQQKRLTDKLAVRFDVVAVHDKNEPATFEWVKNAF